MFILRIPPGNGSKVGYTLTEKITVSFYRRSRPTGETIGGMFRMMEDAGITKDYLQIVPAHEQENKPTSSKGRSPQRYWHVVRRRLTEIHDAVRELRADDVAKIEHIDDNILALRREIGEWQDKRHTLVQQAWRRAAYASLGDLVAQAEEREAENSRKREARAS